MFKKAISAALCVLIALSFFAACTQNNGSNQNAESEDSVVTSTDNAEPGKTGASTGADKYPEFLTVDVFAGQANYEGLQTGWFGEVVKEKFNMELNIIAQNVAGGGDTIFQTRSAAGNLGDIIFTKLAEGRLQDLVTAGLIVDMTEYMENAESLKYYQNAVDFTNESLVEQDGVWAIPCEVSSLLASEPLGGTQLNSGAYIRWDLYKELDYPEMETLEDLLPVMKDMQDMNPTSDSGKKVYAFSLFKDWDSISMGGAGQAVAYYGYGTQGFAINKADDSEEPQNLIADDSLYMRGLKFFFEANQLGILDPESTTQNYDTLYAKYADGAVLYTPWPWLGQTAYNTEEHVLQGKGFEVAEIKDQAIRAWGHYSKGNPENGAMVGSKAKDPQRMVDFIDWLYSPQGISYASAQTAMTCGPEGVTWEMKNGEPVLTQLGIDAFINGDATMPESLGGGSFRDGYSQLNYRTTSAGEINPENGFPYLHTMWDSYQEINTNPVIEDWQEKMGASNAVEYFTEKNQIVTSAGSGFAAPADSSEIATLRAQCGTIIMDYSWRAVFATDEAEYNSLVKEMQETAIGLGYEDVLAVDMANAEAEKQARLAVLKDE